MNEQEKATIKRLASLKIAEATEPVEYRRRHRPIEDISGEMVEPSSEQILDADGNPGAPLRVQDTLRALSLNGTLSPLEYAAGRQFESDCERAGTCALRSSDPSRLPIAGENASAEARVDAGHQVWQARRLLGLGSAGERAVVDIIGYGMTIKDSADRLALCSGRSGNPSVVRGALVAALGVLAAWYYPPPKKPRRILRRMPPAEPATGVTAMMNARAVPRPVLLANGPMRKALKKQA